MTETVDTERIADPNAPSSDEPDGSPRPRLQPGVELLGEYGGSGYKEPQYVVRRPDGQMIQLPALLYQVAERADGNATLEQIAAGVTEASGRGVGPGDVRVLVEEKLRPLGLMDGQPDGAASGMATAPTGDGSAEAEGARPDPMLALRLRVALVPERAVGSVSALFRPLFYPPVILVVLAGLVAVDAWVFFGHGVAQSLRSMLHEPLYLLLTLGLVIAGAAFHEIGHAAACRYGGAKPGAIGAGIYIVWPAFYTDVTDSYKLDRRGRLRTDLGGVYFNVIFILGTFGAYAATGFEPLLIVIYVQHLEMLRQLLPLMRFDGYLILSDLTGVPDLYTKIGPIMASLVPWRRTDPAVRELRPSVRIVTTLWVLVIVPFLLLNLLMIVVYAPRLVATGWQSFWTQWDAATTAYGAGEIARAATGGVRMLMLLLPAAGALYGIARVGGRAVGGVHRGTRDRPITRALAVTASILLAGFLAAAWWPDADYRPIRPKETWTVPEAVDSVAAVATRPTGATTHELRETERPDEDAGEVPAAPVESPEAEDVPATEPTPDEEVSPTSTPTPSQSSPSPSPTPTPTPTPTP